MASNGLERFVVCADTHGDKSDPSALAAFRSFVDDFKPNHRIHAGDVFDLRWLRRAASDEEKYDDVTADLEAGMDLLAWYKPTAMVWGNHDARLARASEDASGATRELARLLIDKVADSLPAGCEVRPYDKRHGVYRLADWSIVHGFNSGATAVRTSAATYGNVMMGHLHRVERVQVNGIEDRVGMCIGCLCLLDLPYNAASLNTLQQRHGFAYGFIVNGRAVVFQAQPVNGVWIFPTEFREVYGESSDAKAKRARR
jgi:predicted phosphodiesterase